MKAWALSLAVICFVALPVPLSAATCESLSGLSLQDTTFNTVSISSMRHKHPRYHALLRKMNLEP